MNVYVCGHGGWDVIQRATVFFAVPAGSEVVFYKEIGNTMDLTEAEALLRGDGTGPLPARQIRSYMQAPDMTLDPCPEFQARFAAAAATGGARAFMVPAQMRLSELIRHFPNSRVHWMACSVRELAETKKKK